MYGYRNADLRLQCDFRVSKKQVFHNAGHKVKMGLTCSGIRYIHVLMTGCHYLVPLRVLAYFHVFGSND